VKVNNFTRWEIKAYSANEAMDLAKKEPNYPEGPGITISAQVKPRKKSR
jgi:hypothetical protein